MLAVLGAFGVAPWTGSATGRTLVVLDGSPSCQPPATVPEGAIEFRTADPGPVLARAAARSPDRILLVTDAVFGILPQLPACPVDVWLRPRRDDIGILDLRLPARVGVAVDFVVEIDVGRTAGDDHGRKPAVLKLLRQGSRVGAEARRLLLGAGQRTTVRIRDRVDQAGVVRYRAQITTAIGDPANDRREALLSVGDKPLVLSVGPSAPLAGYAWVAKRPEEVAGYLADARLAQRVDVILLRGVLPSPLAQERIAAAVRGGAGLVVLGGRGFSGRPLEAVLPLTDQPPGGRAAVLLLDFSGSMHERLPDLGRAVARLLDAFSPGDRVAFVAFRGRVEAQSKWSAVRDARWDLRALRATGNTRLAPALRRAARLFESVGSARRRLFVVSDGKWGDLGQATPLLREMRGRGVYTAALLVGSKRHEQLFDRVDEAGDDLAAALAQLEQKAPDHRIEATVTARQADVPRWLRPALGGASTFAGAERLYPRGVGERVALRAAEIPLLATLEPGGRVVVAAMDRAPVAGLLQACARTGREIELRAWRQAGALRLFARAPRPSPFLVEGKQVAAKPAGPGSWRASVEQPGDKALRVAFAGAIRIVPPRSAVELRGLTNRPDLAAQIARLSGGRVLHEPPADSPAGRGAVYVTLLAAVGFVLLSALRRRAA